MTKGQQQGANTVSGLLQNGSFPIRIMMRLVVLFLVSLLDCLAVAGQETTTPVFTTGSSVDTTGRNDSPASRQQVANPTPCEAAKRLATWITQFTNTSIFQRVQQVVQDSLCTGEAREYAVSFGRNGNGDTIHSAIASGGQSSASIPPVQNAFADLHTHPNNTPPSSGDVYGLLEKCSKKPGFTLRFVCTGSGALYVLFVQDTAAAASFLRNYPPQRLKGYSPLFPEALLDEFRRIRYLHGTVEALALAYILETYKTGVTLFRQAKGQDLRWVRVTVTGERSRPVFRVETCL